MREQTMLEDAKKLLEQLMDLVEAADTAYEADAYVTAAARLNIIIDKWEKGATAC